MIHLTSFFNFLFLSSILGKLYHSIKNLKTSCIGKVSLAMSQIEEEVKEHGETKEKFSAMFQQPAKIRAKKCMREKSFEDKKKLSFNTDQSEITQFLNEEENLSLILNYESSDFLDKVVTQTCSGSKEKSPQLQ